MMRVSFFYLIVGFARTVSAAVPKKLSVLQPQFSSRRLGFGRQKMSHWVQGAECQMTHSRAKINSDAGKKISASLAKIMKDWVTFAKRNSVLYSLASGSMLGYYRDGDRMPYDDDLDVAVCPKKWSILTDLINDQSKKVSLDGSGDTGEGIYCVDVPNGNKAEDGVRGVKLQIDGRNYLMCGNECTKSGDKAACNTFKFMLWDDLSGVKDEVNTKAGVVSRAHIDLAHIGGVTSQKGLFREGSNVEEFCCNNLATGTFAGAEGVSVASPAEQLRHIKRWYKDSFLQRQCCSNGDNWVTKPLIVGEAYALSRKTTPWTCGDSDKKEK